MPRPKRDKGEKYVRHLGSKTPFECAMEADQLGRLREQLFVVIVEEHKTETLLFFPSKTEKKIWATLLG